MNRKGCKDFIVQNSRYIIVFIIFIVLISGHLLSILSKREAKVVKADSSLFEDKNVVIPSLSDYYKIGLVPTNKGDYYRLAFEIRANHKDKSTSGSRSDSTIKISLKSKAEDSKKIGNVVAKFSQDYKKYEYIFSADQLYNDIAFEKSTDDGNDIYMRNIYVTRLQIKTDAEAKKLKPFGFGQTDTDLVGPSYKKKSENLYTFTKTDAMVGQIFKASSNYISGVSFKLDVKNKGGLMSYLVELHSAKLVDGQFQIDPSVISKYEFRAFDPVSYLNQDDEWQFPIAQTVQKDQYYFIGINNAFAQSSLKDNITLKGSKSDDFRDGKAVVVANDEQNDLGNLYFKIFNAEYSSYEGERILTNAIFQDLGLGDGYYTYVSSNQPTDYLDIESSYTKNPVIDRVFYDHNAAAVLGTAQDDTYFTYKFNCIGAIKEFYFEADYLDDDYYKSSIYYSFDNKNWQEIKSKEVKDGSSIDIKFKSKIIASSNSGILYIKVTYDRSDGNKPEGLFGVKDMNVRAEVEI